MKKIFVVLLIVIFALSIVACGGKSEDRVSYRQTSYLVGKEGGFSITVLSGKRESPYIADGERGEMLDFCVITLKPDSASGINDTYTYKIDIDGEVLSGTLKKDTFGSTLSTDLGRDIADKMTAVTIECEGGEVVIGLENMVNNAVISAEDALDIAKAQFKERVLQDEEKGLYREIYLKFVSDTMGEDSAYYWYVAYVGEGGDYLAVLIDIVSGDVIAKRS